MQHQGTGSPPSGAEGAARTGPGEQRGGGSETSELLGFTRRPDSSRPALLMLSHCVPDPTGNAERARAWQWLRMAGGSHQICLACIADGPVHLSHWEALGGHVSRLLVNRTGLRPLAAGCLRRLLASASADRLALGRPIAAAISEWLQELRFDVVLCTHVSLVTAASAVQARLRICDMHDPPSVGHHRLARVSGRGTRRRRHRRYARLYDRAERAATGLCDMVTVCERREASRLSARLCRTVMLPEALDIDYFAQTSTQPALAAEHRSRPRLVVHADWRYRTHRRMAAWFGRSIWPKIRRAVPDAALQVTNDTTAPKPLEMMRDRAVVVTPGDEPGLVRWPILQSLAMGASLAVPAKAARSLQLRNGEHVLAVRSDSAWVEACVELLRNSTLRRRLASHGSSYIKRRFALQRLDQPLTDRLDSPMRIEPALPRAA